MALCLKRVKGLNKVRLVDASFLWTEPHSKRIKIKLTVQKEVFASTILQQAYVLEVVVGGQQCPDCCKIEAKNTWNTVVQVRQKVDHKRTFLYLEQLILKHMAHKEVLSIKTMKDGIDFFFGSRSHACRFVDFLDAVVPIKYKTSERLITQDVHSGDSTYKFTFSVEIIPICKDDLICLPPKVARSFGGMSQLVLCTKVGTSLHFIDPNSLAHGDMTTSVYWREPFSRLASIKDAIEYFVLDIEPIRQEGRFCLADAVVAKASDFGHNSITYTIRTHLGHILKPGDMALGFDLTTSNFNDQNWDDACASGKNDFADVVLIRKSYAHLRRSGAHRAGRGWKIKELEKEQGENFTRAEEEQAEKDYEKFMEDIEEDVEMRAAINVYRDTGNFAMDVDSATEENDLPKISLEELLEDLCLEDTKAPHPHA
jgi:nonsense-mediated mRNA decay protein 3